MTISNEERREVAESMREEADNWRHSVIGQSVNLDDVPAMWRDMMRRIGFEGVQPASRLYYALADLIDVPSCCNVSDHDGVFECSECLFRCEVTKGIVNAYGDYLTVSPTPEFCPCCGAEVVDE